MTEPRYIFICFLVLVIVFGIIARILYNQNIRIGTTAKTGDTANRWNKSAKPTLGGIIFLTALICWFVYHAWDSGIRSSEWILLICGSLAFSLGMWDDVFRMKASKKMLGQLVIACVFACYALNDGGANSLTFGLPTSIASLAYFLFVVVLTVGLMNSVNMLDNMDGISTIAAIPVFVIPIMAGDHSLISVFIISGLIGFLMLNWPASKIFMGDSGSLLLGFMVAWVIVEYHATLTMSSNTWSIFLVLISSCSLFICDTMVVVINRLRHGVSPAQGGRDHTTHNLVYLGLSEPQVATLFVILGSVEALLLWRLSQNNEELTLMHALPAIGYFFLIFTIFFSISIRNLHNGKYEYKNES